MFRIMLLLVFLLVSPLTLASVQASKHLAGAPGDRVAIDRGGLALEASAPTSSGGTEELVAAPGESVSVTWRSGGAEITVTVVPQPGEGNDSLTIRLAQRVNALRKSFPVDPPPGG